MTQIEVKNLSFSYLSEPKKKVLNNINLAIAPGQYITLCGKSGSGKSTLLKHFKSVLMPAGNREGEILFQGNPLSKASLREQSSQIGFVMQNPDNQLVTDKVWHELAFGLESLGFDNQTIRLRVAEMASYFGIQSWFYKKVSELSGGQKQLLNLASIMAMQPAVLMLDEPTSQLDPIAATNFLNTIRKINLDLGTTILISEHRLDEVFPCSDKVAVLDTGKLFVYDEPRAAGRKLKLENHEMFEAMPAPMQIFYQVNSEQECPITVREGRTWLSEYLKGKKLPLVEEKEPEGKSNQKKAILMKEVWVRYGKEQPDVLKGINLEIQKGSLYAVLGGNGTGKSTMLKAICNIVKPSRGKVYINNKNVRNYKSEELYYKNLAMLPQDPQSLFVKNHVRDELEEMISADEKNISSVKEKIKNIVQLTQIAELLDSHPYDLSGGEQQRVALAKILLMEPKILLLDEPTKGIDMFFKKQLAKIFKELNMRGVTIVMVSHDVEFCANYADKVGMLFDGAIITENTPGRFFTANNFYTTAANRMSRHLLSNAVTIDDVTDFCRAADRNGKDE